MARKSRAKAAAAAVPDPPQTRALDPASRPAPQSPPSRIGFMPIQPDGTLHELLPFRSCRASRLDWLWPPYVPRGRLVGLTGPKGSGKSVLATTLMAHVSRGTPMGAGEVRPPGRAIWYGREEDPDDDVLPRLVAAGGDPDRCHVGELLTGRRTASIPLLPDRIHLLEQMIETYSASLVVFDPLASYLASGVSRIDDQAVRSVLEPLAQLARRRDCTILAIMQPKKGWASDPLDKVSGSPAWTAVPRHILALGYDPAHHDQRILTVAKSSGGARPPAVRYTIEGEPGAGVWTLGAAVSCTAEDLLAAVHDPDERQAREEVILLLRELLAEEAQPATDCMRAAKDLGVSPATARRAKRQLGIRSVHATRAGRRLLLWERPAQWPE